MVRTPSRLLIWGIAAIASQMLPITADAEVVDRDRCIAAEIALGRGIEAMEGTKFVTADGKQVTLGRAGASKASDLAATNKASILAMADDLTPGAVEYADLWLVGPGSVGRSEERLLTEKAKAFVDVYIGCLNVFGSDF